MRFPRGHVISAPKLAALPGRGHLLASAMMLTDMVNVLMVSTTIHLEIELVGATARTVALRSEGTARNGKGAPGGAPLSAELASSVKVVAGRRNRRDHRIWVAEV